METPPLNDHITNKYWAGLFTDLSIEQTYMRDIKGNGGLTRGRGMEEGTRLNDLHAQHYLVVFVHNTAVQVCGTVTNQKSHIDLGVSRKMNDFNDTKSSQKKNSDLNNYALVKRLTR